MHKTLDTMNATNQSEISQIGSQTNDNQAKASTNILIPSEKVKLGKSVYIIQRHFSGERDMTEAVFTAVKNEAFRAG